MVYSSALLIAICKLDQGQADGLRLRDVRAESLEVFCPVRRLCKANWSMRLNGWRDSVKLSWDSSSRAGKSGWCAKICNSLRSLDEMIGHAIHSWCACGLGATIPEDKQLIQSSSLAVIIKTLAQINNANTDSHWDTKTCSGAKQWVPQAFVGVYEACI